MQQGTNVEMAYDQWAEQYDSNQNRTRDMEAISLREVFAGKALGRVLEMGCGTGKNTSWMVHQSASMVSVDLSAEMLAVARQKVQDSRVEFIQADMTAPWAFAGDRPFDTVVFSLVLEHIDNLDLIFEKLKAVVVTGGMVYVGELHPFKQYTGSKARFDTEEGTQVVTCFNHHISDFTRAAALHGFRLELLREYFDAGEEKGIPRILTLLFSKS